MTVETTENPTMEGKGESVREEATEFDPSVDEPTVKFLPEKGATGVEGDVELADHKDEKINDPLKFNGLTKEDLQQFANDPFWVKVRYALFGLFVVIWIGILVAAILIVVLAPSCPPRPDQEWYQEEVVYNICPSSFQDSNGDGVGDIKGVLQHMDYFSEIGVKALLLSSIFESPQVDGGYDATDHKAIDSLNGTLSDLKMLLEAMKKKGMKLLLDFIPNHTSVEHEWFKASKADKVNDNANFYVWSDGKMNNTQPPNNWLSVYGGSAWTLDPTRQQWYLHQFQESQPDLNLGNAKVQDELMDILTYWLDIGVDGFLVHNAQYLFEAEDLSDEPMSGAVGVAAEDYAYLVHNCTTDQPENFALVAKWKELLDNVTTKSEVYRALIVDAGNGMPLKYTGHNGTKGADVAVNKNLTTLTQDSTGNEIKAIVDSLLTKLSKDQSSAWMIGNQDTSRVASRMGRENVNIVNMLQLLLPGTPIVYYGTEIGMVNGNVTFDQGMHSHGKNLTKADDYRTPMQWDGSANAGFTNATNPWLPVSEDFKLNSVKAQRSAGVGKSNLEVFEELTTLRTNASFLWGDLSWNIVDDNILSFVRKADGFPGYLVVLNFGDVRTLIECHTHDPDNVPMEGEVVASSANFNHVDFAIGKALMMDKLVIGPSQGVVFKLIE